MMKKVFALTLSLTLICLVFAGCGKKTTNTSAVTVQNGDIANIDYEGKKNGVPFDGGTAQGYDLTIGSGQFIPGFEDGLIGKEIGSTVDLNLTFPENYRSADLAGQAVVFTVKINSVKRPLKPEKFYDDLGFKSVDEYYKDLESRTGKKLLLNKITELSEIQDYPKEDFNLIFDERMQQINQSLQSHGTDLATYLQQYGETEESFKVQLESYIREIMNSQMIVYAIFDKENLRLKKAPTNWQEESEAIQTAVEDFLYNNTKQNSTTDYERILYKNDLEDYVKLGDYKTVSIDTESDAYKEIYNDLLSSDVTDNNFYSEIK